MKQIRKTTAKTRIGVLNWLHKLNPLLNVAYWHDTSDAVAVHIDKYTGKIIKWEAPDGTLYSFPHSIRYDKAA